VTVFVFNQNLALVTNHGGCLNTNILLKYVHNYPRDAMTTFRHICVWGNDQRRA